MTATLVCWQCGVSIAHLSLPLSRFDECRSCRASLHACRLCQFHEVTVAKQCREPIAEEVKDKERANFCDYFQPRPGAWTDKGVTEGERAKAALAALFGGGPQSAANPDTAADDARRKLDDLFGGNK